MKSWGRDREKVSRRLCFNKDLKIIKAKISDPNNNLLIKVKEIIFSIELKENDDNAFTSRDKKESWKT